MKLDTFIFDMDGVLCDYDLRTRLEVMHAQTGIAPEVIHERLWASGFEDEADRGAYRDGQTYLDAFARQLQHPVTREEWIKARAASMTPFAAMLEAARDLGQTYTIAILTNNVPLMEDTLAQVFPQTLEVFGTRIYFSCSMGIGKPDTEIFRRTAELCGVSPDTCLFIDDKTENVAGAIAAGMQGIHFSGQRLFLDKLRTVHADNG